MRIKSVKKTIKSNYFKNKYYKNIILPMIAECDCFGSLKISMRIIKGLGLETVIIVIMAIMAIMALNCKQKNDRIIFW